MRAEPTQPLRPTNALVRKDGPPSDGVGLARSSTFNPARFAGYFRELAGMIADSGAPPDHLAWVELYARYETTFYDET